MTDRRSLTMADTQMDTSGPAVGIDLGTTNSCVAVRQKGSIQIIPNDQGNRTTPSFVAFTKYERLIGDGAKNQAVSNFSNTIFDAKRLIGRRFSEETVQKDMKQWPFTVVAGEKDNPMIRVTYKDQDMHFTPEEISSMVLIKMKEIAETYLGCPVKNAVVTVPAYFNDSQRRATKDAGQIAGLNVLQIINEPTAAALAYGLNEPNNQGHSRKPKHVFVFDFGGGTLDVCALEIKSGVIHVMAVNGDTHLGGQDIDSIMVDHFVKEFQRKNDEDMKKNVRAVSRLRAACERAKRTLSAAIRAEIELDSLYGGIDFKGNITRAKFEDLLEELFERCMVPVEKCLKDAGLTKGDIHEVLIVGGSTRIPKVQSMLKEFFAGKNLCSSIHAEEAVAYGAAVQAAALDVQSNEKGDIVVPVIKRNTAIPCKEEKTFPTSVNYQKGMTFHVYEGERSMASDNNLLGVFALDGLEPKLAGEVTVLVTFQIDENGILNVSARDYDTGRVANVTITNEKGRLTGEQIDAMIKAATKYRLEDEDRKKAALAKLELEDLLYKLKKFMSNKELVSSLEEAKKQSLKTSIDDTLEWSEKNEHEADVHQFRSKKKRVENIWKSTVGATLHWSCFAASLAMDFMS